MYLQVLQLINNSDKPPSYIYLLYIETKMYEIIF